MKLQRSKAWPRPIPHGRRTCAFMHYAICVPLLLRYLLSVVHFGLMLRVCIDLFVDGNSDVYDPFR